MEVPPYTFREWLLKHFGWLKDDTAPELLYDGYVFSLQKLGYKVYGDCYKGIEVRNKGGDDV